MFLVRVSLLFFTIIPVLYSQEKPSSETPLSVEKRATGFEKTFGKESSQPPGFKEKSLFTEKKFEVQSATLGKSNAEFNKKFDTKEAELKKSFAFESKSFPIKSAELHQKSTLAEKETELTQKKTSDFTKTFETKAYEGRETPQAQREIRELLKQKSGSAQEGDRPLTMEEVKQIVNRDGHITPEPKK